MGGGVRWWEEEKDITGDKERFWEPLLLVLVTMVMQNGDEKEKGAWEKIKKEGNRRRSVARVGGAFPVDRAAMRCPEEQAPHTIHE